MFKKFDLKLIGALTSKPYAFSARSWELESLDFLDFYDSMLSTIRIDVRGLSIMRVLPRINESLNEEWISDKIRFSYDGFRRQRLLNPLWKNEGVFQSLSWEESFFYFSYKYFLLNYDYLNTSGGILGLYGKFIDLESSLMFKEFIKSFKYTYSNLLSCGQFNLKDAFMENFLSANLISDIHKLECCILVGSNLRYENPIIHLKFLRLANQGLPIFTFGVSSSSKIKSYSFGYSLNSFFSFLEGKNKYSLILKKSKFSKIIVGDALVKRMDLISFHRIFNLFKNLKLSFSFLQSNPTELGLLALGILDNRVNSLIGGINASMFFNYNSDEIVVKSSNIFKIYQGHHGDVGALQADLIFPSTFLLEKKGTFLSVNGEFSKFNFIMKPGNSVRSDWRIFKALSLYLHNNVYNNIFVFKDLNFYFLKYIPEFFKGKISSSTISLDLELNEYVRFDNTPLLCIYNNYYMTDQVSKASKIMALSLAKFKKNNINF
jgi:NADH-quinone oxidoreductase subunit G